MTAIMVPTYVMQREHALKVGDRIKVAMKDSILHGFEGTIIRKKGVKRPYTSSGVLSNLKEQHWEVRLDVGQTAEYIDSDLEYIGSSLPSGNYKIPITFKVKGHPSGKEEITTEIWFGIRGQVGAQKLYLAFKSDYGNDNNLELRECGTVTSDGKLVFERYGSEMLVPEAAAKISTEYLVSRAK